MKSVTQHVISEVNIKSEFEKTNKGMLNIEVCTIKQLVQMKQILNKKSNSFWFSTVHMCKKEKQMLAVSSTKKDSNGMGKQFHSEVNTSQSLCDVRVLFRNDRIEEVLSDLCEAAHPLQCTISLNKQGACWLSTKWIPPHLVVLCQHPAPCESVQCVCLSDNN